MDFPLPTYLIAIPLVGALVTLLTGRWRSLACGVGVVGAVGFLLLAALLGPDAETGAAVWVIAGRDFELTPFVAQFLALLAAGLVLLLLLHWFAGGPAAVVPGGLAALGLLALAFTIRPFALGAVGLLAATAVTVPALAAGGAGSASATWRAFLPVALAMPLLVIAGWLLDSGQTQGEAARGVLLVASLLLLGGFPFYVWLAGIAREAPLQAVVLLAGLVGAGTAVWLALALESFPVVRGSAVFQTAAVGSALVSAVIAAFGLSRASGWRDALAYGLVFDAGMQTAALAVGGASLAAVLAVAGLGRLLALLVLAVATSPTGQPVGSGGASSFWPRLWLVFGGLALLGLPLTPAFAARWVTLPAVAGQSVVVLLVILAAMGVSAVGIVRVALAEGVGEGAGRPTTALAALAAVVLFLALFMGIAGPHLLEYLSRLAAG